MLRAHLFGVGLDCRGIIRQAERQAERKTERQTNRQKEKHPRVALYTVTDEYSREVIHPPEPAVVPTYKHTYQVDFLRQQKKNGNVIMKRDLS